MKKLLILLMVAGMFSIVACGPTEEETKAQQEEVDALTNDIMDELEDELGGEEESIKSEKHVCDKNCTEDCHAKHDGEEHEHESEGHDHEGEEHDHDHEEVEG